jgi:glucose/mannose-6-phosphate isomerase
MIIRLRQQLNENSKILCSHHVFPEMNHNELVGWRNKNTTLAVLVFRDAEDHKQVKRRMDICKPIFEKYTDSVKEIFAEGNSLIEKTIYFIHLGDWVSFYLSEMREVDVTEVKVIDFLKSELLKR